MGAKCAGNTCEYMRMERIVLVLTDLGVLRRFVEDSFTSGSATV